MMDSNNDNKKNEEDSISHHMSLVTTHGCQQIYRSKSTFLKICWTIFLMTSMSVAAYLLHEAIDKYYKYRTHEDISLKDRYVDFPAVTVCRLDDDTVSRLFPKMQKSFNKSGHKIIPDLDDPFSTDTDVLKKVHSVVSNYTNYDRDVQPILQKFRYNRLFERQSIFQGYPVFTKYLNPDFDRFVVSCQFKDKKCNQTHFVERLNGEYLKCFTFTHFNMIKNAGLKSGLSITFYLDTFSEEEIRYYKFDNSWHFADSGVKVAIHEPNTIPDMINDGFIVSPGFSTDVALTQSVVEKMEPPWGECDKSRVKIKDIANEKTGVVYNRETCMKICKQRYINGKCGCLNIMLPVPNDLKNKKYCLYLDQDAILHSKNWTNVIIEMVKRADCEEKHLEVLPDSFVGQFACDCPLSCKYHTYDSLISQANWPPQNGIHRFALKYVNEHLSLFNGTDIQKSVKDQNMSDLLHDIVKRDFLRLNVYYRSLTVQTTVQVEAYTIQDLISEIGGIIGICVGMSVLSILEMPQLIAVIVEKYRKKLKQPKVLHMKREPQIDQIM